MQRNSSDWYKKDMKLATSLFAFAFATALFAQGPMSGGGQQVSEAKLKQLTADYKASKAAFAKKPKDAKVKKKYVDSTFAVGMGTMYGEKLSPHQKYAGALDYFREVLKVEPKHKLAKENYDMIVKIYKQMGRPVPGEKG